MWLAKIYDEKEKNLFLLPIMYSWTFGIIYILFDVFDLVNYVEIHHLDFFHNRFLLLSLWAGPCALTLIFTGIIIDYYPNLLDKLLFFSLLGTSLSLLINLYALIMLNELLMSTTVILLGFFFGILIVSSQTLYSIITPLEKRGKAYSIVISGVSLFCIFSIAFLDSIFPKSPFLMPLFIIGVLGLIFAIIFYFLLKQYDLTWINEKCSTKLIKILTRPSVLVYFWSNTLIWTMLGLMIGSLAQVQTAETLSLLQSLFSISPYKGFWIVVVFGMLLIIMISGPLSDIIGRKSLIVFSTTGLVLASLVIAIFDSFLISTLLIGFSFACAQTFNSLWVDLASRDSIGRYNSLNFSSMGLGFIIGFIISFFFYMEFPNFLNLNIFILLGIAVFASLPLFWISDSYPPLEFFLLLVTNKSGIPMFHYNFQNEETLKVDLSLISGALTALSSFMVEAIGESQAKLSLIRHGSHFIIAEESNNGLSGSIFSNKNDPELQHLLKRFLNRFQEKYGNEINNWHGNLNTFTTAVIDAEEIFGHLITLKT